MIKFGTGGWRAVIGDEFTKANIRRLSKGLADKMKHEGVEPKGIILGYDRRFLSKESMHWAAEVFAGEEIPVFVVNRSEPTPLIMFYVEKHHLPYGMMITASHNPAVYNGIKVFTYGGRDADEEHTQEIERYANAAAEDEIKAVSYAEAVAAGKIVEINPRNEYLDNIIRSVDMEAIRSSGLKVALDPMYGVSETSIKTILLTARCEVETIHERHDTLFGGKLPAPTSDTLKRLQHFVTDRWCDIGIATDGDADRIGVIDDQGKFLHPNDILVLLYYYLVEYKKWKGPAVRNIATTHRLDKIAKASGERCYEVPVGFKYISAKMAQTDAILGGESSGGLTVRGHINGKDGIYAAILLVEMIAVTGKKLSVIMKEIHQKYGDLHMEERDYSFSQQERERIFNQLMEDKELPDIPFAIDKVSYLDGCKIYLEQGGWIIARFSGTEPLLRIFCEMPEKKDAVLLCENFEAFLKLK